jgi:uncharacterized protein YggE
MRFFKFAFVGTLAILCAAQAAPKTVPVVVQGTPQAAPDRFVVMTGVGTVRAMPDKALVSGGVVTRARHADDAIRTNSEAMAKVVAALKALGITDKEIATSSFSFDPQYETDSKGNIDPDHRIVAYTVENKITVTLTEKIERAGEVLDALIQNGANDSAGVWFDFQDPEALNMRARAEAAKNALTRAETYVKQIGAELGAVRSVQEGSQFGAVENRIVSEDIGAFPDKSTAEALQRIPGVRVAAGERTITQVVTVVWNLK